MIRSLSAEEALELWHAWRFWARPEQLEPPGGWAVWLICAGRAWGKTRTGAEWVNERVAAGDMGRIALVARTAADARDVMVEGESGLLATAHPSRRPRYERSNRRLTWPNGAIATTYSAEEPDALRGPQHDGAWADELAAWQYDRSAWDMLQFGLRLGKRPRAVVTTTPRPTPLVKELIASPACVVTRGSTYANRANLAPSFLRRIEEKYEGTRLGRQEIHAEVLEDNPHALWKRAVLDALRVAAAPAMRRIVVAVDPAVTAKPGSNETGIVVIGLGTDGHGYVLADHSMKGTPAEWGMAVVSAYRDHEANVVIGEVNQGGDLVESNVQTCARQAKVTLAYRAVRATRGKATRAEPVAALYEQARVHHVGSFAKLEDEMCEWDPAAPPKRARASEDGTDEDEESTSPDRLDALVWGLTELMVGRGMASTRAASGAPGAYRLPGRGF